MRQLKRGTVYFDPGLHKALRLKAAHSECSVSGLVNAAVRHSLAEDAQDLAVFRDRAAEPALSFEDCSKALLKVRKPAAQSLPKANRRRGFSW